MKFECSQKVNVSSVSEKGIGSSTKLTNNTVTPKEIGFIDVEKNMQVGVDEEQVYHSEVKKNDNNTNVTVENRQIGFFDVGENMEIGVDEGKIDHSEVQMIDNNDNVAVKNMQIDVPEEQVDHSEVKKIEDNALVTVENMQIGVDDEQVDHSEVKKVDDNAIVTVENMLIGVDEEQVDHSEVKKVDDNAHVTIEDILNDVHSSSFKDSDGEQVQVTDSSSEAETGDLDAHKMVVKGKLICFIKMSLLDRFLNLLILFSTNKLIIFLPLDVLGIATTKNAYTSGAKFESSQKKSISPASWEMIGSSTNLLNISVTPIDIGFSDGEENMRIGVNKEEVDHSQMKNTDENTDVAFEDILDEVRLSNFEDSDGTPARFLPTEVRTSILDVQEMVVTGILICFTK